MALPSKFQLGQIVDVVRGGFEAKGVPISAVTFFVPSAPGGILGTNAETEGEEGVKYAIDEPVDALCHRAREVWAWMLELSK